MGVTGMGMLSLGVHVEIVGGVETLKLIGY
jgi:hypothetical protein